MVQADFDLDGYQDVAFAESMGGRVSIVPGDGKGGFKAPVYIQVVTQAYGLTAGDFDQDGMPDLALPVKKLIRGGGTDSVVVLLNRSK